MQGMLGIIILHYAGNVGDSEVVFRDKSVHFDKRQTRQFMKLKGKNCVFHIMKISCN